MSSETCPADGIDNDCDGYTDETIDEGAEACGPGVCSERDDAGLFRTYKKCGDVGCSTSELTAALPRFATLDVCTGEDNDCSGVANAGPARVLLGSADEVELIGDENIGDPRLFRAVFAERFVDGGFNVVYARINRDLTLEPPQRFAAASPTAPLSVSITNGGPFNSAMVWRESATKVGFAKSTLNDASRESLTFNPPITLLSEPYIAQVGSELVLTAGIQGGAGYSTLIVKVPLGGDINWTESANVVPIVRVKLKGDGRQRATLATTVGNGAAGMISLDPADLRRTPDGGLFDGGPDFRRPDGGPPSYYAEIVGIYVRLLTDTPAEPKALAVASAGGVHVVAQVNVKAPIVFAYRDTDDLIPYQVLTVQEQFPEDVEADQAEVVAAVVDGGTSVLFAGRLEDGGLVALAPSTIDGGYQFVTTASGKPALAWSSKLPNYALLATPEVISDGGTAVVGRLVCMPQQPIR